MNAPLFAVIYTDLEFPGNAMGRVDVVSPDRRTQAVLDVVRSLHHLHERSQSVVSSHVNSTELSCPVQLLNKHLQYTYCTSVSMQVRHIERRNYSSSSYSRKGANSILSNIAPTNELKVLAQPLLKQIVKHFATRKSKQSYRHAYARRAHTSTDFAIDSSSSRFPSTARTT